MFITEIFPSIQGETTFSGMPCLFIRTAGCNLRCRYCDTSYAYSGGQRMSVSSIETLVNQNHLPLVSVTGGEPLLQEECIELLKRISRCGKPVLLETNGSISLKDVDKKIIKIVDVKCPSSGEGKSFLEENIQYISNRDELKFVLCNRKDYEWARKFISKNNLLQGHKVLLSPVSGELKPSLLAGWMLKDSMDARLQLQLHRIIWPSRKRKV